MLIEMLERYWAKVDRRTDDECWPWSGPRDSRGYGRLRGTRPVLAIAGQRRPSEAHIALHLCDNPRCVNPSHLRWGTTYENHADMMAKDRQHKGPRRRRADQMMDRRAGELAPPPTRPDHQKSD